jgi:hypothetical protein
VDEELPPTGAKVLIGDEVNLTKLCRHSN